jgi:hypothetical protein
VVGSYVDSISTAFMTSCAIRGARGGGIGRRSPLGSVRSWVGLGVVRGVQFGPWAAGGSVAGDPDRHRGWLLFPSSVPAAQAARVLGS